MRALLVITALLLVMKFILGVSMPLWLALLPLILLVSWLVTKFVIRVFVIAAVTLILAATLNHRVDQAQKLEQGNNDK